ncbi:hypothetical protein SDC9_123408 [bioreactor metagenome]|uniref:Uncharacterized protein n=1 Tax=bioreactor metagenome TaxID=1076179 RepID=A0A645CHI7_9ZZZZ
MLLYKARGFLRFIQTLADLFDAIRQTVVSQQIQTRQQAVKRGNALFRLFVLQTLLLVFVFVGGQRTFQLNATAVELANFGFRIGFKSHRKMAANEAAERLMQTLRFLNVKRERGKTLG